MLASSDGNCYYMSIFIYYLLTQPRQHSYFNRIHRLILFYLLAFLYFYKLFLTTDYSSILNTSRIHACKTYEMNARAGLLNGLKKLISIIYLINLWLVSKVRKDWHLKCWSAARSEYGWTQARLNKSVKPTLAFLFVSWSRMVLSWKENRKFIRGLVLASIYKPKDSADIQALESVEELLKAECPPRSCG